MLVHKRSIVSRPIESRAPSLCAPFRRYGGAADTRPRAAMAASFPFNFGGQPCVKVARQTQKGRVPKDAAPDWAEPL